MSSGQAWHSTCLAAQYNMLYTASAAQGEASTWTSQTPASREGTRPADERTLQERFSSVSRTCITYS